VKSTFRVIVCLSWIGAAVAQTQQPPATPPVNPPAEPAPPRGIQQAPPPIPKVPDVRQPGETGYFIGIMGWFPTQKLTMNKGREAAFTEQSKNTLAGKPKYARGAEVGLALGLHNALRFSYFDARASGDFIAPTTLHLWEQTYDKDTLLTSDYRLQNGKISFDYLTWPYPVESRRFRLKTLWQLQYTSIRTGYDAPKKPLTDNDGFPLVDSAGNPITFAGQGSRWFVSPQIGVGLAYYSGRHFRLEANAAGFTIPKHNSIWDADASANVRYGRFEVRFGAKGFHFKTSTNSDFFMRGTYYSGFAGIRWYSE
jgi:hypothetical protein